MKPEQISAEIERVEKQLSELREKLKEANNYKKPHEAKVGDKLEDGSIVVVTYKYAILVVAPQETEVLSLYDEDFSDAFSEMSRFNKFKISEWFAPSMNILQTAMVEVPEVFGDNQRYWSSTSMVKTVDPEHNYMAYQRLFRFIML